MTKVPTVKIVYKSLHENFPSIYKKISTGKYV